MRSIPAGNHLPQRAVNDREDHVDLGESLSIAGIDKLPLRDAGYGGDANF
jgi:hypothetical protein